MELANRMELEADFARKLSRVSSRHRRELIDLLGSPPDPRNVPETFWAKVKDEQEKEVTAALLLLFMASFEQHSELFLPGDLQAAVLDTGRDAGSRWATERASKLAGQYVDRSRAKLAQLERRWYGPDFQIKRVFGELKAPGSGQVQSGAIEIFGPDRDATIATTETTGAQTAGTGRAVGAAGELGVIVTVTWFTELDGRVCPICKPLHGQQMKNWEGALASAGVDPQFFDAINANGGPPIHPNCRCFLQTKVEKRGAE